jgi:hypothetical protein
MKPLFKKLFFLWGWAGLLLVFLKSADRFFTTGGVHSAYVAALSTIWLAGTAFFGFAYLLADNPKDRGQKDQ